MRLLPKLALRAVMPIAALLGTHVSAGAQLATSATLPLRMSGPTAAPVAPVRVSADAVPTIDLAPVAGRDFKSVYLEAIGQVRALGLTPFVELGGPGCPPCEALRAKLQARPIEPGILQKFEGAALIRLSTSDWGDHSTKFIRLAEPAKTAIGMDRIIGIPLFFAIDTTGRQVAHVYGIEWITGEADITQPDGPPADRDFMKHHLWSSPEGQKPAKTAKH